MITDSWKYSDCVIILIFSIVSASADFDDIVRVRTSKGALFGKEVEVHDNIKGVQFFGVPYGEPAIGKLLLKKTVPVRKWKGELNATTYKDACPQGRDVGWSESEDCLHVNVFTSRQCMEQFKNCPVMAFIHGGKNLFLSPVQIPPDIPTHNWAGGRNVIFVTIGYRLGIWGFFNLHPHGKGKFYDANAGLWDIIEALKWIRREIRSFGGNPRDVTLMGHSSGSNLVDILSQSPIASSLFDKQIMMSPPYIGEPTPTASKEITKFITKQLGCAKNDDFNSSTKISKIVNCMSSKSWREILEAQFRANGTVEEFYMPAVDGKIVVDNIRNRRKLQKPRPTLVGTVTKESRHSRFAQDANGFPIEERVKDLCSKLSVMLEFKQSIPVENSCVEYYMNEDMPQYISDDVTYYSYSVDIAKANEMAGTFLYSFSYDQIGNISKYKNTPEKSPAHAEEMVYLFPFDLTPQPFPLAKDNKIQWIYSGFFSNFAKYGSPSADTPYTWTKYDSKTMNYFDIYFDDNFTMPQTRENYYQSAVKFWKGQAIKLGEGIETRTDYPPKFDSFPPAVIYSSAAHYTNELLFYSKALKPTLEMYKIITEYVDRKKSEEVDRFKGHSDVRAVEFEEGPANLLIFLSASIIILAFVPFGIMKFYAYQRRKNYQRI